MVGRSPVGNWAVLPLCVVARLGGGVARARGEGETSGHGGHAGGFVAAGVAGVSSVLWAARARHRPGWFCSHGSSVGGGSGRHCTSWSGLCACDGAGWRLSVAGSVTSGSHGGTSGAPVNSLAMLGRATMKGWTSPRAGHR